MSKFLLHTHSDSRTHRRDAFACFEKGRIDWDTANFISSLNPNKLPKLKKIIRAGNDCIVELGSRNLLVKYPGSIFPPKGSKLCGVESRGVSIRLLWEKSGQVTVWNVDAIFSLSE